MKLPLTIDRVTIIPEQENQVFPPIGFLEIEEGNNGAGDCFGLYWQLGKEKEEPIVCELRHEEFLLVPVFPNLDSFIKWFEETEGQEAPTVNLSDKKFFLNLFNRGKVYTKNKKNLEAVELLEESITLFNEYSDSWALLAENYLAIGNIKKAEVASMNSVISNYTFGLPSKKAVDLFNSINEDGELKNNPLIKRKNNLISGGDFKNPFTINYDSILESIIEFKELNDFRSALIMEQNYGLLMQLEKAEVRNKYQFDENKWIENFVQELRKHYPERR